MSYANPHYLVDTEWLASHLSDPNLRIYDCTTHLIHQNDPALPGPYRVQSGLEDYLKSHIPGAAFIDLQEDLSDSNRSEEHTSELQSQVNLACRLLPEKKNHTRWRIRCKKL